jgi:hypothetical protein
MEASFDMRGYLKPYGRNKVSLEKFKEIFVNAFDHTSSRHEIFESYVEFLTEFRANVTVNFTQWVNGSFVSKKQNPNDLDFLTLIDFETYNAKETLIDRNFRMHWAKAEYPKLDAFTVKILPEAHKNSPFLKYDLQYWEEWFGNSRPNRANQVFPKGYLEIHFDESTKI